jgi:hypothetical protein
MDNFQKNPLKLYIQDIFRAKRTAENKYIYESFGMTFKNIMIHGVVTEVWNNSTTSVIFELSDATGSVQVYYDKNKNNLNVTDGVMNDLKREFVVASKFGDPNIQIMNTLMDRIRKKKSDVITQGIYVSVVGDIFLDDKNVRTVSAYECGQTSVECDLVWMEELKYLYEKFYLWSKK